MRRKSSIDSSCTRPTMSSKAAVNASPVDRTEFQTLASLVRSLKEESTRHLKIETEAQCEMDHLTAQMQSTRKGLGKLGELLQDDFNEFRNEIKHEMQALQVDCIQRIDELSNAVERLEFRFTHHIRDCKVLGDEVDRLKDALHQTKLDLHRTETDSLQRYNHIGTRLHGMDELTAQVNELNQYQTTMMQEVDARLAPTLAALNNQLEDAMDATNRRWISIETTKVRQDTLIHSILNDLGQLREQTSDIAVLRHVINQNKEFPIRHESYGNVHVLEEKLSHFITEYQLNQTRIQNAMESIETNTETRLDTLAQTLVKTIELIQRNSM